MNKSAFLFFATLIIAFTGCNKEEATTAADPEVEAYIRQLKSGEYKAYQLPEFSSDLIPALLKYRNETVIITRFPVNPISSYLMPECRLGMYVLWTIESIRAKAAGSKHLVMGFPSQNPVLQLREGTGMNLADDDRSHAEAANAYYDWWYGHKGQSFESFKQTDPLSGTKYRWH